MSEAARLVRRKRQPIESPDVQVAMREASERGAHELAAYGGTGKVTVTVEFDYRNGTPCASRVGFSLLGPRKDLTGF